MWAGSWFAKFTTITTFLLLFTSKAANVAHPLILGKIVSDIGCDDSNTKYQDGCPDTHSIYMLIIIYACTKFGAELLNYLREVPFAYVAANAELHVATKVYRHIQR